MRKILILLFLSVPSLVRAETIVTSDITNAVWTAENNPYIVQSDILVSDRLEIGPGVVVRLGDADIESFKVRGVLDIRGTKEKPVIFESNGDKKNWSLNLESKDVRVHNVVFRNSFGGIILKNSEASFEETSFTDLGFCFSIENSSTTIRHSELERCNDGMLYAEGSEVALIDLGVLGNKEIQGIVIRSNSNLNISNSTIQDFDNALISDKSVVKVSNSKILNNKTGMSSSLSDVSVNTTDIVDNDIGVYAYRPVPPSIGGEGNMYTPKDAIVIHDNNLEKNNVYDIKNDSDTVVDATNNWWGSNDGPKKNEGNISVEPWITRNKTCCSNILFIPGFQASRLSLPGNKLWEPNRNADVEKLFQNEKGVSKNTVTVGDIVDKGIGYKIYDLLIRELDKVVDKGTVKEWRPYPYDWRRDQLQVAKEIVPTLETLASTSITGKVNILSHSNGGLIAKGLIKYLREMGKESLVDSIVYIAVPHIGTPKAIGSMLYGYDQDIAKGLILNKKTARQLGYNSPGAYGLLPSTYKSSGSGVASSSKDLESPMALNSLLLNEAKKLHNILDTIKFPKTISITGWNVDTPSSLTTATKRGDGTVIASSSDIHRDSYFFDLKKYGKSISHANITEAIPVMALVKDLISSTTDNKSQYEGYISKQYPTFTKDDDTLQIKMFSPVDIHVYDSEGRHTGVALNQREREIEMDMEPGFVTFVDEEIPGSSYSDRGVKTISVPNSGTYTVKGIGTDDGVFTLQTSVLGGDDKEKVTARYEELPVLKDSRIELGINTASSVPDSLKIDIENDGVFEKTIRPNKSKKKINIKSFIDICKKVLPYIKKHEYHKYLRSYFED